MIGCKWVLTWFTHNIQNDEAIVLRLWDFLIGSDPTMIIFLSAAIILRETDELNEDTMMEIVQMING